jgi:hypothetical protein
MTEPIATTQNGKGQRRLAPLARRARRRNYYSFCVVLLSVTSWLFLLLSASSSLPRTTATEVKWTASSSSTTAAAALDANGKRPKETAATAPRSQKYWDEHNIERPDYAKTDAELAQEKYGRKGDKSTTNGGSKNKNNNKIKQVCLLLLIAGALGYFVVGPRVLQQHFPGSRLGSASGGGGVDRENLFPSWLLVPIQQKLLQWQLFQNHQSSPEEKARAARLARFEAPDLARFEAKDD